MRRQPHQPAAEVTFPNPTSALLLFLYGSIKRFYGSILVPRPYRGDLSYGPLHPTRIWDDDHGTPRQMADIVGLRHCVLRVGLNVPFHSRGSARGTTVPAGRNAVLHRGDHSARMATDEKDAVAYAA